MFTKFSASESRWRRFLWKAQYGAAYDLTEGEAHLIRMALEATSPSIREALERQLEQVSFVQRGLGGRMVVFYYLKDPPQPIEHPGDKIVLARVLSSDEPIGKLVLFRGHLKNLRISKQAWNGEADLDGATVKVWKGARGGANPVST